MRGTSGILLEKCVREVSFGHWKLNGAQESQQIEYPKYYKVALEMGWQKTLLSRCTYAVGRTDIHFCQGFWAFEQ